MKRTLSTEQLPTPSQKQDSGLPVTLLPCTAVEQTQSEPTLFNFIAASSSTKIAEDINTQSIRIDEHSALEKSDRSSSASSAQTSAITNDEITALLKAAEQGDAQAQFKLGVRYDHGDGVEENKEIAFMWTHKAADQGNSEALSDLGERYICGSGTEKNEEKGFECLHKAAEQGYAAAQCNVGVMYANGVVVEKDGKKAFMWFSKAAEQGYAAAQCNVGLMYADGTGVEKDEKEALQWYLKAAEQGYVEALFKVGLVYDNGAGVEVDEEQALKWYFKAAEQGHVEAQFTVGNMYRDGVGVDVNTEDALKWYLKAARQGHAAAHFNVGKMYRDGVGVDVDKEEAFKWFHKAAELNHSKAQQFLSRCYRERTGAAKDLSLATYWRLKSVLSSGRYAFSLEYDDDLIELIPSTLQKYPEFKRIEIIRLSTDTYFSQENIAFAKKHTVTISNFIRSNHKIGSLQIYTTSTQVSDDQICAFAEALKSNANLTQLGFPSLILSKEMKDQIEVLLTQNRNIAELKKYVKDLRIENTPGFPFDVVKKMVNKTIVTYLKSGQTMDATQKAIDELLIISGIKALEEDIKIT